MLTESLQFLTVNEDLQFQLAEALRSCHLENNDKGQDLFARASLLERWTIYFLSSCSSTMDVARELLSENLETPLRNTVLPGSGRQSSGASVIISLAQRQGRGRQGRNWYSAPGEGLYLSLILPATVSNLNPATVSLVLSYSVFCTLERLGIESALKWPNDVLVEGAPKKEYRKIAGLLLESRTTHYRQDLCSVIAGVGININQQFFPQELPAISAAQILSRKLNYISVLVMLLQDVTIHLEQYYGLGFTSYRDKWWQVSLMKAAHVSVQTLENGALRHGIAVGLADDGALLLRAIENPQDIFAVYSGEVHIEDFECRGHPIDAY